VVGCFGVVYYSDLMILFVGCFGVVLRDVAVLAGVV